jgi:hypothetical protein
LDQQIAKAKKFSAHRKVSFILSTLEGKDGGKSMKKYLLVLALSCALLGLGSCNPPKSSVNQATSSVKTGATTVSVTSSSSSRTTSSSSSSSSLTPSNTDKAAAIAYCKSNGSLINGSYLVATSSSYDNSPYVITIIRFIEYTPSDDSFSLVVQRRQTEDGEARITCLTGAKFYWSSYDSGVFLTSVDFKSKYYFNVTLLNPSFASDGQLTHVTYSLTKNTFPSTVADVSSLRSLAENSVTDFNKTVVWVNSLGLPSLR